MKPKLPFAIAAIVAFIICSFQETNGQNVSPFWSLTSNSNTTATSRLGTSNWMPLRFFTNNVERMRVNNGGNIGIGTIAPAQKLHVAGNININTGFGLYLDNQKFLTTPGTENLYMGFHAGEISGGGGFHNTIIGFGAGMNNFGANNTFCGQNSGLSNINGTYNAFYGLATGQNNTSGDGNSFLGQNVMWTNTSGSWNCSVGFESGNQTTTSENCFYGVRTGFTNETGSNNTYIGAYADAGGSDFSNSSCLGHTAQITASNQVRIGNSAVTSIGGFRPWTNLSDGRFKKNIKENVPGLEFISQLRPVTYTLDMDALDKSMKPPVRSVKNTIGTLSVKNIREPAPQKDAAANAALSKIIYTGFVAQEVEEAAKKLDFDFSGVDAPKNDKDYYGLRYSEFVVPLVKAVQELDSSNKAKDERISKLEDEMMELKQMINDMDGGRFTPGKAWMKQNTPNPALVSTTIQFSIPDDARSARIIVTNELGQQIKVFNVSGTSSINFNTGTLPSGTYNYSLVADSKTLITKKLVIAR